jgi:hypothetical protein
MQVSKEEFQKILEEKLNNFPELKEIMEDSMEYLFEDINKETLSEKDIEEFFNGLRDDISSISEIIGYDRALEVIDKHDWDLTKSFDIAKELGYISLKEDLNVVDLANAYLQKRLAEEISDLNYALRERIKPDMVLGYSLDEIKEKLFENLKEEIEKWEYPFMNEWIDKDELEYDIEDAINSFKKESGKDKIETPQDLDDLFDEIYEKLDESRIYTEIIYSNEAYDFLKKDPSRFVQAIEDLKEWYYSDISDDLTLELLANLLRDRILQEQIQELQDEVEQQIENSLKQSQKEEQKLEQTQSVKKKMKP